MADNFTANAGSGGNVFAADDISSVFYPRVKISHGADGSATDTSSSAPFPVQTFTGTTGGANAYKIISAATTNAANIKASTGQVYGIYLVNLNAAVRYLKLYNMTGSPTVGTSTPELTFAIPASTTGAGFVLTVPTGIAFTVGIAMALTTGVGDSDSTAVAANEIVGTILYK
jgi:hypothetical protein